MGERGVRNAEARSSILLISTNRLRAFTREASFGFENSGLNYKLLSPVRLIGKVS